MNPHLLVIIPRSLRVRSLRPLVFFVLLISVLLRFAPSDPRVGAQGECRIECSATVPALGRVGVPVQFSAVTATSGCASGAAYEWDFGDGTGSSLFQNTSHFYNAPGTYSWKLTTRANTGFTSIDTVAGGYGEGAPARQASLTTPVAVARDPQGRGVYLVDALGGGSLLRFLNTSNTTVTIAGRVVSPGTVRVIGGGGAELGENIPAWQADLGFVVALATNASGDLLYFADQAAGQVGVINTAAVNTTVAGAPLNAGNVRTFATGFGGNLNGIAVAATGEVIVADATAGVNKIFKLSPDGRSATAIAGNGVTTRPTDAAPASPTDATQVPLLLPRDILFDGAGNLFVADAGHARIVKVDATGKLSLVVQFPFNPPSAPNPYPAGLAFWNGDVYVANGNAQTIVRVTGATGIVAGREFATCDYSSSTCGDGSAAVEAQFFFLGSTGAPPLVGIEADANGLFILDQGVLQRGRVRYLNLNSAVTTLAGVTINPGRIETLAGNGFGSPFDGGLAVSSVLNTPTGVALDVNNNLWISDSLNGRLRFVNRGSETVTIFPNTPAAQIVLPRSIVTINKDVGPGAIDGVPVTRASFETPQGLTISNQGVFVADSRQGPTVDGRRTGLLRFINTTPANVIFYPNSPKPLTVPPGNILTIAGGGTNPDSSGDGGLALEAKFIAPSDVAVNPMNGDLYVADSGNKAVRKISSATGRVSSLNLPPAQYTGLAFNGEARLFVVNAEQGQLLQETAAGSGVFTVLNSAPLSTPRDVAVDANGNAYVTESGAHRIVRIRATGAIEPLAGTERGFDGDGSAAANARLNLSAPAFNGASAVLQTVGIALNASGELLFADTGNNRVRRVGSGAAVSVCAGTINITGDNPIPALNRVSPDFAVVGGRSFTLTVNGNGFVSSSRVRWNGQERATTYISSTQLAAQIPATDLGLPQTVDVSVANPTPGGGVSNIIKLAVILPNPLPSLTAVTPDVAATGTGFMLTVTGSGFNERSVVQWNGSNRTTSFISGDQLRAEILPLDVQRVGAANITVFNPEPGGGTSNKATFTITAANPAPVVSGVAPVTIMPGSQSLTLLVNGSNFSATSRVRWNGLDRPTTFLSTQQLQADIPASDVATAGAALITVFTPLPGGGLSNSLPLAIGQTAASVPAANFSGNVLAVESVVSVFGTGLATATDVATSLPLPTTLRGTTVAIRDSRGGERLAPLFFVSPTQVNYFVPPETATGPAVVLIRSAAGIISASAVEIVALAPGLFSADATGQGIAAAVALRVKADNTQSFEPIVRFDAAQQRFIPVPIDLGAETDQVFLVLFGSGLRNRSSLASVVTRVGGEFVPATFAGPLSSAVGVEQINLGPLPRKLAGRSLVDVVMIVDGKPANIVQVVLK